MARRGVMRHGATRHLMSPEIVAGSRLRVLCRSSSLTAPRADRTTAQPAIRPGT